MINKAILVGRLGREPESRVAEWKSELPVFFSN